MTTGLEPQLSTDQTRVTGREPELSGAREHSWAFMDDPDLNRFVQQHIAELERLDPSTFRRVIFGEWILPVIMVEDD